MNKLTNQDILQIRTENQRLINVNPNTKRSTRYKLIAGMFNCSEWTVRWICQGLHHASVGGFIEHINSNPKRVHGTLSGSDVTSIRAKFSKGAKIRDLAAEYSVSQATIIRLVQGKTYRANTGSGLNVGYTPTQTISSPAQKVAPVSKINSVDVFLILASIAVGKSVAEVSRMYNLTTETINNVVSDMKKTHARLF